MPKTPAEKLAQLACEGSCASQHWPELDDFGHKPPRGRWKHPAIGSANHTRKVGGRRRKGSSSEYVAKWSEGIQLEAEYNSSLSLRDACVVFFADEFSSYRSQFISRAGAAVLLLSFDEYKLASVRATTVRPETRADASLLASCARRPLGIGIPFSRNNIWHQSFHAIPAWEALRGTVARARAQGVAPTFVPLVLPKAGLGRYHSQRPADWFAWELTLRPLSPLSAAELAAQTAALLAAPCVCFDRVEAAGGTEPFNALAPASAPRVRAFTQASAVAAARVAATIGWRAHLDLDAFGRTATRAATRLILAARGGATGPRVELGRTIYPGRYLANAAAVEEALEPLRVKGGGGLHTLRLEELSLAQQMLHVSSAGGLIAVHGQAVAWLIFLPHGAQHTALVEVMPRGASAPIYQAQARALGVRYEKVRATIAADCPFAGKGKGMRGRGWLDCNLTVPPEGLFAAARRAAEWVG